MPIPKKGSRTMLVRNTSDGVAQRIRLTDKELAAVKYKLEHPTASNAEAVRQAGYSQKYAEKQASQVFNRPRVLAILEAHTETAQEVIANTMKNRKDKRLAFDAAREVLDRTHGKPVQRTELSANVLNVSIDLSGDSD